MISSRANMDFATRIAVGMRLYAVMARVQNTILELLPYAQWIVCVCYIWAGIILIVSAIYYKWFLVDGNSTGQNSEVRFFHTETIQHSTSTISMLYVEKYFFFLQKNRMLQNPTIFLTLLDWTIQETKEIQTSNHSSFSKTDKKEKRKKKKRRKGLKIEPCA